MKHKPKQQKIKAEPMVAYSDYPIGTVVAVDDEHYLEVALTENKCSGCFFNHNTDGSCFGVVCLPHERSDKKDVIYKKIDR